MTDPKVEKWMKDTVAKLYEHVFTLPSSNRPETTVEALAGLYAPVQQATQGITDALEDLIGHVCIGAEKPIKGAEGAIKRAHDALAAYRNATRGSDVVERDHNWVDATNEVITGGEVCLKCMAIRASETGGSDE